MRSRLAKKVRKHPRRYSLNTVYAAFRKLRKGETATLSAMMTAVTGRPMTAVGIRFVEAK